MDQTYIALDVETTGLNCEKNELIEIAGVAIVEGHIVDQFCSFVRPRFSLPSLITSLTGITDEMLADAQEESVVIKNFLDFFQKYSDDTCKGSILGHNVSFDYGFLKVAANRNHMEFHCKAMDTLYLSRKFHIEQKSKALDAMCELYGIQRDVTHRAYEDAIAAAKLYECMKKKFYEDNPQDFIFKDISYKPKKVEPMTEKQKRYLISLCQAHSVSVPLQLDNFTKSQASQFIDHLILNYGRMM